MLYPFEMLLCRFTSHHNLDQKANPFYKTPGRPQEFNPLALSKMQKKKYFIWIRIQMSNEKNLGWLGYIGDEILPSYIGIIS